jgi:Spy/CpxP family protein refolding chaperone
VPYRHYLAALALAGAFLGAQTAAYAQTITVPTLPGVTEQTQPGNPIVRNHPLDRDLRQLNLSTQQHEQIRQIRESYRASRTTGSPESREAMLNQIRGVLTPAQQQQFNTQMQHRRVLQR